MNNIISNTVKIDNESIIGFNIKIYRDTVIKHSKLCNGVSIGDESRIRDSELNQNVEIGRRNTIDHVSIGKGSYTGEFCIVKYCSIGKYNSISWNVSIGGANHQIERLTTAPNHRIFFWGGGNSCAI